MKTAKILIWIWLALIGIAMIAHFAHASTITTINGSDTISGSRTTINTNFSNLNTDKVELTNTSPWTALQKFFGNASTTGISANYGYFGSSATTSIDKNGVLRLATTTAGCLATSPNGTVWSSGSACGSGGGGSPGGSNGQVQFNNSSSFGGDSKFIWDNTNKSLDIGGTGQSAQYAAVFANNTGNTSYVGLQNTSFTNNTSAIDFVYPNDSTSQAFFNFNTNSDPSGSSSNWNFGAQAPNSDFGAGFPVGNGFFLFQPVNGAGANVQRYVLFAGDNGNLAVGNVTSNNPPQQLSVYGGGYFNSNVGIGTTTPFAGLSISGSSLGTTPLFAVSTSTATATTTVFQINANGGITINSLATTTASSGFNITKGCYAISNICLNSGTGTVTSVGLSDSNSTLTIGSTPVTTSGTITATLNLSHANTWSTLQTFTNSSTTLGSFSGSLWIPSLAQASSTTSGQTAIDTTSNELHYYGSSEEVIYPKRTPGLVYATSTAWTATTTIPLPSGWVNQTINAVQCYTDAGTLNVDIYHTTTHLTLLNASTTQGQFGFTANNTMTPGEKWYAGIGTPLSSPTQISCTFKLSVIGN